MIKTNAFDYINVLDKAADASWLRNEAIANNIANVDTPGYKREDITFESELSRALKHSSYVSMDEKVKNLKTSDLKARTYKDYSGYSYRLDGNNVDIDSVIVNIDAMKSNVKANIATDDISRMDRYRYLYRNDVHCYRQFGFMGWMYIYMKKKCLL